jgi:putative Flp pilus-assembly TadE/G-like protein
MQSKPAPATQKGVGQILVIFAGGLIALFLIAALVIDLGFVFMIRRQEQNAVDPAAIAAARYIKAGGGQTAMADAACFYAHQSGYFGGPSSTATCVPANDPWGTVLTVNYPPSAAAGNLVGRTDMVEVIIQRPHQTFLGNVIGLANINVSSSAVAAFSDGNSNSNSLIALDSSNQCSTANVSGGASVTITAAIDPSTGLPFEGGYVHVNSSCGNPSNLNNICGNGEGSAALKIDGSGSNLSAPHVFVHGTCTRANNNSFSAPLTEDAVVIGDPLADIPEPQISDYAAGVCMGMTTTPTGTNSRGICSFNTAGTYDLAPGVYYGGWDIRNNVTLHLAPGVYIIAGGGIKLNAGGSITSVSSSTGTAAPIMIFNTDNPSYSCPGGPQYACQQNVDFTASSTLTVRGIDSGPYRGILIWQDGTASGSDQPVTLGGQTNLTIAGTVYAPKALVTLTGGSSGSGVAAVQIISWQFNISGGAALTMPFDPRELYRLDQKGLVH